ncbi:MAG: hypothetical protein NZ890_22185 [Myxococcota bacterium]|nr:hypothetical protein [Myxococcota bacterium]
MHHQTSAPNRYRLGILLWALRDAARGAAPIDLPRASLTKVDERSPLTQEHDGQEEAQITPASAWPMSPMVRYHRPPCCVSPH